MPSAPHVAQAYLLRLARYAQEFLTWTEGRPFRNPDTGNEVKFTSLPAQEQTRIYEQWTQHAKEDSPTQETPSSRADPREEGRRALEAVREGKVVESRQLSEGGRDHKGPGVNQSEIVTLEHEGERRTFIRKAAEGETKHLRVGIPGGTYHTREQAFYDIDALLGGRGIVPVTATRGSDDGSYQQWSQGARAMQGADLDHLARRVKPEDLHRSPDFHRLNLLDLILGHEDRHRGNILYHFEGEETPENLRLVAIDNGLSMASPSEQPDHRVYIHPFGGLYEDPPSPTEAKKEGGYAAIADGFQSRGNAAVADSLSSIRPELRDLLDDLDLNEVAQSLTAAGIHDEGAVRAALTRIAVLQHDPEIFQQFLDDAGEDGLKEAWQEFQHLSGQGTELLERAGAQGGDIDRALERARPKHGWAAPQQLDTYWEDHNAPAGDDKTRKDAVQRIAAMWLREFSTTSAQPRAASSPRTPSRGPP
jgi:hypothetical protein